MELLRSFDCLFFGRDSNYSVRIQQFFEKMCIYPNMRQITDTAGFSNAREEMAWDILLFDLESSDTDISEILRIRNMNGQYIPVVLLSDGINPEDLAEFMKKGLDNYVRKGNEERLAAITLAELERKREYEREKRYCLISENARKFEIIKNMAGNISYTLNNVLMVILNTSAFLLEDKGLLPHLKEDVENILAMGRKGEDFARRLLMMAGGVVINPNILEAGSFLYKIGENLRGIMSTGIDVNVERGKIACQIKGDEILLLIAFRQLGIFLRDLMRGGGSIVIRGEVVNLEDDPDFLRAGGLRPFEYLKISMISSATGINGKLKGHIFEPFYTRDGDWKKADFGPALSNGIIWEHNGLIEFGTESGDRASFYVYLPLHKKDSKEIFISKNSEYTPAKKGTVLIVEDDEEVKNILIRIFREEGYSIMDAADGLGALVMVQRYKPDLAALVTDVIMPRMGGLELAREFRRHFPDLKVVFISGFPDNDGEILRFENSIFIQKPLSKNELMKRVKKFIWGEDSE